MAPSSDKYFLQNSLLKSLYFHESQSCAELSAGMRKSIPVVTRFVNELIEEGYVVTKGYAPSSGGRRPLNYSLKNDNGFIVAVAMDQLFTRIVILDLANNHVADAETVELDLHHTVNALELLAKAIRRYIEKSGITKSKIIGVGIGMPGFINVGEGINYTFFDQNMKVSHRSFLEKEIGLPVCMDNDSSLTALAEWMFGPARNRKNALIVNIGWGTGLGMIMNGQLFRGDAGYAGEFSHIPLSDNGILCECGKRGCLETETSLLIMAQKAVEDIRVGKASSLQLQDVQYMSDIIIASANKGDQYCIELLTHVGSMLGKGIAILIHIINPGLIVLSGRGAKAKRILMAPIQQALNQYCIPRLANNTEILFSETGEKAGLTGAAALVMEHVSVYKKSTKTSQSEKSIA
ncbi:MAG: ROK family protein [Chitinophagaceae bacterium]|nr:MAG: ROK family protein [Chitinophagaceae bacterium]